MSSDAILLMNEARRHKHSLGGGALWRCPITGVEVPKHYEANLRFRSEVMRDAVQSLAMQDQLRLLCSQSILLWLNLFGWTYRQNIIADDGVQRSLVDGRLNWWPFITWPCQDDAAQIMVEAVQEGRNVLIDKSRDMGATWLFIAVFHWFWQFHRSVNFLEISRKQELVDKRGNPKSLFWKHDRLLERQPRWLQPRTERTELLLANKSLGSTISGEATTGSVGQGDRTTAAAVDEASRIRELDAVVSALRDTTSSIFLVSTPNGPSAFSRFRFGGTFKTITLGYWDHPEKGRNRVLKTDPKTGKVYWSTPWFEHERFKRSKDGNLEERDIAENILIDHMSSGSLFFDTSVLARQRSRSEHIRPSHTGTIRFEPFENILQADDACREGSKEAIHWHENRTEGKWRLWVDLETDTATGLLRPPAGAYVLGIDIARGVGASNSVISVFDRDRGIKVAEFADGMTGPYQLARVATMAGIFFASRHSRVAFAAWENNGPGGEFRKEVLSLRYNWFYYKSKLRGVTEVQSTSPGWDSSRQAKYDLLEDYRGALASDEYINPSTEALDEAAEYLFYDDGSIGPGKLKDENANARATHGDRVIADALAWMAAQTAPRMRRQKVPPPHKSIASRRASEKQERARDLDDFVL